MARSAVIAPKALTSIQVSIGDVTNPSDKGTQVLILENIFKDAKALAQYIKMITSGNVLEYIAGHPDFRKRAQNVLKLRIDEWKGRVNQLPFIEEEVKENAKVAEDLK